MNQYTLVFNTTTSPTAGEAADQCEILAFLFATSIAHHISRYNNGTADFIVLTFVTPYRLEDGTESATHGNMVLTLDQADTRFSGTVSMFDKPYVEKGDLVVIVDNEIPTEELDEYLNITIHSTHIISVGRASASQTDFYTYGSALTAFKVIDRNYYDEVISSVSQEVKKAATATRESLTITRNVGVIDSGNITA